MTNKESIQIIKEAMVKLEKRNNSLDFIALQELAAFNKAIKALEQMDRPNWGIAPDWAEYYDPETDRYFSWTEVNFMNYDTTLLIKKP